MTQTKVVEEVIEADVFTHRGTAKGYSAEGKCESGACYVLAEKSATLMCVTLAVCNYLKNMVPATRFELVTP